MSKKRTAVFAAIAGFVLALPATALAASYPERPIRIVVPFATGGGTDIQARVLAESLGKHMNATFVVENKSGASGLVGAQHVIEAPADGYTILFTTATLAINPTLYGARWTVDPVRALDPLSWISSAPLVLVTHPSVPAKTVKDLVEIAKSRPGFINAAVNTPGSTSHLAAEMLKQKAGLDIGIVPFKGGGPALRSVMAGETDFVFATGPAAAPHVRSRRVRALAVTTPEPSPAYPGVPTLDSVYPGFHADNWYAMFVRDGTPAPIVQKLNGAIRQALGSKLVREFMAREALKPVGSSPEALLAQLKREMAKYRQVIQVAGISLR